LRVLILGGDSFVGKFLISLWREEYPEDEIFITSRRPIALREEVFFDYGDSPLQAMLTRVRPQLLVNLISYMGKDNTKSTYVNVNLPREILQCQKDLGFHTTLFGSAAEYGLRRRYDQLKETSPLRPQSSYGVSKAAQSELAEAALQEGAEIAYLRVFNIFGHNMHPVLLPGRLQESALQAIREGHSSIDLGRADDVRDFIYLTDLCSTVIKLVGLRCSGILNLGSGRAQTVGEFADFFVHDVLGQPSVTVNKSFSYAPTFSIADVTKLEGELHNG